MRLQVGPEMLGDPADFAIEVGVEPYLIAPSSV
jgi:hypothetical protein